MNPAQTHALQESRAALAEVLDTQGWRIVCDVLRAQIKQQGNVARQKARAHDSAGVLQQMNQSDALRMAVTAIYKAAAVEIPHDLEDLVAF
jgi:hypothetical protein